MELLLAKLLLCLSFCAIFTFTGCYSDAITNTTDEMFLNDILAAINYYRACHGVGPLTLNWTMVGEAETWAAQMAQAGKISHDPNKGKEGENVYSTTNIDITGSGVASKWYDESINPGFTFGIANSQPGTSDFAAIIWSSTNQVGFGRYTTSSKAYIVARFLPAGNVKGRFITNVPPPTNGECATYVSQFQPTVGPVGPVGPTPEQVLAASLVDQLATVRNTTDELFINSTLDAHNYYRACHGLAPLTLNASLNADADMWAHILAAWDNMTHDPYRGNEGENLAWSSGYVMTGTRAVSKWYNETYDPGYTYGADQKPSGTGHFTQVIWSTSTQVGLARAQNEEGTFIVARYYPPGNVVGQYSNHVPAPVRDCPPYQDLTTD